MSDQPNGSETQETAASAPIYDDKAHVRGKLDLTNAEWQRAGDPADAEGEYVEIAFVPYADGKTYIAMRNSKFTGPNDTILVFTESEWDAFVAGARDGEFDEPW
ncbi:MAG TPA: DUF397 domain-containing protein [Pseudonocardiaceae bacterium]|jgi:hypothetical protein|nr:DUF397 domain-containing protein [Pseudonocardiaceae bacterium]